MTEQPPVTPKWTSTTKLVVGLSLVAIVAALVIQFRNIIGPLILAFMLAYLLYPVARWISKTIHIPWQTAVGLIYLVVLVIVLALFTATGVAVVQQLQSLISFIQNNITNLPQIVADLSQQTFTVGPFEFSLAKYDLTTLTDQLLSSIQPLLGRAGNLLAAWLPAPWLPSVGAFLS